MPVTILELAKYRLTQAGESLPADGSLNGGHFERVGLPILGGCEICEATVAAYNACPSKTGFLRCKNGCIEDEGWETVEEANRAIFESE